MKAEGWLHKVDLTIGGHTFTEVPVIFTYQISKEGYGMIGHRGVFDKARISFDFQKKQFEIVPKR